MRIGIVKGFLLFLMGLSLPVVIIRFIKGLGATTNLTDITPWGFWIGFDVVGGVALAAGGFVIAATVYIFHLEKYRPVVRPAILTAFLGYVAVAVGLIFDLGLPWNIWHPMIHWQDRSALFEVAWCVMLYLTVLALEFSPVVLEKTPFHGIYKFMKKITLPLVILGICLSTLHQSSLGTLFTIMPFRLHPLWYSSIQPYLFLISAVGLGLCMVIAESVIAGWIYDHKPDSKLLSGLGKAASYVLGLYLIVRFTDLIISGRIKSLFEWNWESLLFIFEILLGSVVPILVFSNKALRDKLSRAAIGAIMVVLGFVLNRINVSGVSTITLTGSNYVPSWMEISISLGVVAAACFAFMFFVENFSVYESNMSRAKKQFAPPSHDLISDVRLDLPWAGSLRRQSLVFILAIALGFALIPDNDLFGSKLVKTIVKNPRLVEVPQITNPNGSKSYEFLDTLKSEVTSNPTAKITKVLIIDGDRNGKFVLYNHDAHSNLLGGASSCSKCHHINKPYNLSTACYECHKDMYLETDIFLHDYHVKKMGNNQSCKQCHKDNNQPKNRKTAVACLECHKKMIAQNSLVKIEGQVQLDKAPSYKDAMHGLCISCHKQKIQEEPQKYNDDFARCKICHNPDYGDLKSDKESL
jgi:Ni/Fe-hydrogenase subunit HybB-like protein